MTVDELRAEADKLGYYITQKKHYPNDMRDTCGKCKWLDFEGGKSCIGYECVCPHKKFRNTSTAHMKYTHTPACKCFVKKEDDG